MEEEHSKVGTKIAFQLIKGNTIQLQYMFMSNSPKAWNQKTKTINAPVPK